jgi:hypothetical protein
MSERAKFAAGRQSDVEGGVMDIKLCPSIDFKGDATALAKAYNEFDAAAANGVFVEVYEENLDRRSVAEILS